MEQNKTHWKKCNKCQSIKDVSCFGKESRAKNGYKPRCKECTNNYYNENYINWKDKKLDYSKKYSSDNKELIKERRKHHKPINKDRRYKLNVEWRLKNKERLNEKSRIYEKERVLNNDEYRCLKNMRKLIYRLKIEKRGNTSSMLGYTLADLKNSLGRLPDQKESLDHKIPITWFLTHEDFKIINAIENLQILTRSENSRKNNCFSHPVSKDYYDLIKDKVKPEYLTKINIK